MWLNLNYKINNSKGEYATIPDAKFFNTPKIFLREIAENITACYDDENFYSLNKAYVIIPQKKFMVKYVLGILNSKLLAWYFRKKFYSAHIRGGYLQFKKQYTSQIPIKNVGKTQQQQLVDFVDKIHSLQNDLKLALNEPDKKLKIIEEIQMSEAKIDKLVYKLYGITPEEQKILGL